MTWQQLVRLIRQLIFMLLRFVYHNLGIRLYAFCWNFVTDILNLVISFIFKLPGHITSLHEFLRCVSYHWSLRDSLDIQEVFRHKPYNLIFGHLKPPSSKLQYKVSFLVKCLPGQMKSVKIFWMSSNIFYSERYYF